MSTQKAKEALPGGSGGIKRSIGVLPILHRIDGQTRFSIDLPVPSRYFFVVTNYFLYGESIIYYFKVSHLAISQFAD